MKVGRKTIFCAALLTSLCLAGCDKKSSKTNYKIEIEPYDKVTYETVDVMRGDVSQELNFTLSASVMESVTYYPPKDDMKIKSFNYMEGDIVNEGDLLLEYDNDSLNDKIRECQATLESSQLLVDHYTKLIELGDETCTQRDIDKSNDQITVSAAYLEELNAQKEMYNISAKSRGIISSVSNMVDYGTVSSNDQLFTVVYGDGMYYVYMDKDCGLKEGLEIEGKYAVRSYRLKLVDIEPGEGNQADKNKYIFEYQAVNNEIPPYSTLEVCVNLEPIKNVIYVPEKNVYKVGEEYFVIVEDENGLGVQRKVSVSDIVNGVAIISEGLSENERIMIK